METCLAAPTTAYAVAELILIGIAVLVAFFSGGAIVWWRMTGLKGRVS